MVDSAAPALQIDLEGGRRVQPVRYGHVAGLPLFALPAFRFGDVDGVRLVRIGIGGGLPEGLLLRPLRGAVYPLGLEIRFRKDVRLAGDLAGPDAQLPAQIAAQALDDDVLVDFSHEI